MSEAHTVSPLLDSFTLGEPFSNHHGITCCPAIHSVTKEKFILKQISIPESQIQVDAMLLTGACDSKESAGAYYEMSAQELEQEIEAISSLSKGRGFVPFYAHQVTKKENDEVGVDLHILSPFRTTLEAFARQNPMTHLAAVNLGIDLCAALALARQAGYLYLDLKPENIMVTSQRQFQIGDLGLQSMDMMEYATFPDKYRSEFTAPELFDDLSPLNTTADLYSLGMVLHRVFNCGNPAFPGEDGENRRLKGETVPAPVAADEEMAEIIARAVAFKPEDRWLNPEEMGSALVAYMQKNTVNDSVLVPPAPPEPQAEPEVPEEAPQEEPTEEPQIDVIEIEDEPVDEPISEAEEAPAEDTPEEVPAEELFAEASAVEEAQPEETPQEEPILVIPEEVPEVQEEPQVPEVPPMEQEELEDILSRADSFLAVPKAAPAEEPTRLFKVPEETEAAPAETGKTHMRNFYATLVAVVIAAALILGGLVFYSQYYCVPVKSLEVVETGLDTLTVAVSSRSSELRLVCQDTYGNLYNADIVNGKATFTDLNPGTQYTVSAVVDGFHKITGTSKISVSTGTQTEIVDFDSMIGAEDGSVMLLFTVNGAEPAEWTVHYSTEGEDEKTRTFTGHNVSISGLEVGKDYTFRLEASDGIFITGQDSLTITASAVILAQNLHVTEYSENALTVAWNEPETPVESWTVRCYDNEGVDQSVTVTSCTASFQNLNFSVPNTVEITAAGMTQNTWIAMTADPACLSGCTVDLDTPGQMTVEWTYTGTAPQQWVFLYSYGDDAASIEPIVTDTASAVVSPMLPNTSYVFTIQSASGSTVFNNLFSAALPEASAFRGHGVTDMALATYAVPQKPETEDETEEEWTWGLTEVLEQDTKDTFAPDETPVLVLTAEGTLDQAEAEVSTLIVVRNADGVPVDYVVGKLNWNEMWTGNHYLCELTRLPQAAGTYTIEVYLNSLLAASAELHVN